MIANTIVRDCDQPWRASMVLLMLISCGAQDDVVNGDKMPVQELQVSMPVHPEVPGLMALRVSPTSADGLWEELLEHRSAEQAARCERPGGVVVTVFLEEPVTSPCGDDHELAQVRYSH